MSSYLFLVPVSLVFGVLGLLAFLWTLKREQYDDLDGAAQRILADDEDKPLPSRKSSTDERTSK